jgi:hypothetical protein
MAIGQIFYPLLVSDKHFLWKICQCAKIAASDLAAFVATSSSRDNGHWFIKTIHKADVIKVAICCAHCEFGNGHWRLPSRALTMNSILEI